MDGVSTLLGICLLLGVCNGGDGNPTAIEPVAETRTGVFADRARGLRFETPTQSGRTNANGEFSYREGEIVTFSIGAIVLGSAPGAPQITPFDLFGTAPPSTAAAVRVELRNRGVTDLDRVANIAMLLMTLDKDSYPGNGLDLTGWDKRLENYSLSFDEDMFGFGTGRISAV